MLPTTSQLYVRAHSLYFHTYKFCQTGHYKPFIVTLIRIFLITNEAEHLILLTIVLSLWGMLIQGFRPFYYWLFGILHCILGNF